MKILEYKVEFLTPAFLGNAKQRGQWRTPPFKALLRQWWRIVRFAKHGEYPCGQGWFSQMRKKEGEIFGTAEDSGSRKSLVRIRLDGWEEGGLNQPRWSRELPKSNPRGRQFDPMLYIGYGLLKNANQISEKRQSAIETGGCGALTLAVPESELQDTRLTLALIHHYGTMGGRSRNGWGSIALEEDGDSLAAHLPESLSSIIRPWKESLALEWPHAIGRDEKGPLIWQSGSFDSWHNLMKDFGRIRKELRKIRKAPKGSQRIPNTIRFKARRDAEQPGKLKGIIFHVPCSKDGKSNPHTWSQIHRHLDEHTKRIDR